MSKRTTLAVLAGLLAATLPAGCHESISPERTGPIAPDVAAAANGIALDQQNGALGLMSSTTIRKGFNPTNPRLGTTIIATFFWLGSAVGVPTVTDHLADGTPVGNTYHLVAHVTGTDIAMATFVATDVQNFPEGTFPTGEKILVVEGNFSAPIVDGGILISSYTGVDPVFARALGAASSGSGSGSTPTIADPGTIGLDAGALAYGVTMANRAVGLILPPNFTTLNNGPMANTLLKTDGEFAVQASAGLVNPQWTWFFDQNPLPGTWLATVLALNPAIPEATQLAFTVQPSEATVGATISPAVEVAALDVAGNIVMSFAGPITIALGNNPGGGTLSGTTTVTAVNGVATFSDLSIDQPGDGYTLVASATGLTDATSTPFNITPLPATHLVFTVQPSNTTAGATITPAVQVAAQDNAGNTVVGFSGDITVALGDNPGNGTLSGTTTVTAVNGVAIFSNLSINNPGIGYTLVASANGLTSATSAPFDIVAAPSQVRARVSGGGRIDPAVGKTTFGFEVDGRSGPPFDGEMQVVYHGAKTRIHSLVIDGLTSSSDPRGGVCITWTGTARVNNGEQRRFTATACDNGQPGSGPGDGPDRFGITVDGSVSTGLTDLKGGNIHVQQ